MHITLVFISTLFASIYADSHANRARLVHSKRQSGAVGAVIAFGGSYSDNGRARDAQYSSSLTSAPYAGGRKTNGATSVEHLASSLNSQLRNYAYNGAQIDNALIGANVPAVKDQVTTFINDVNSGAFTFPASRTLVHFYAGIESLVSIWTTCINAGNTAAAKSAAATKVTQHVNALLGQVSNIRSNTPNCRTDYVFMTSPPLEIVLQMAYTVIWDSARLSTMTSLETQFNNELTAGAAALVKPFSKVSVVAYRDFWYDAQYNPSKYGLSQGGTACYSGSGSACAPPQAYLYFDTLNPSTAMHKLLADRTLAALGVSSPPPGPAPTPPTPSPPPPPPAATPLSGYWPGANSYYLWALNDADRFNVLDNLMGAGYKVIRIFLTEVYANSKGSGNPYVPDLETNTVGTYDDTILLKVDQLMVECAARGMRLIIALHDRYALAYWVTDAYSKKYGISAPGGSGSQKIAQADGFYNNPSAIADFDNRLRYIMAHRNAQMGNRPWSELDSVIYAVEAENEPQGHMNPPSANPGWVCGRSALLASLRPAGSIMLISSGGGVDRTTSLQPWASDCAAIQIVAVHGYDLGDLQNNIASAKAFVHGKGKQIIVEEYGAVGANKATQLGNAKNAFRNNGVSQMVWEVMRPGKGSSDYEVWVDEPSWAVLQNQ